jgi:hypothetical protein
MGTRSEQFHANEQRRGPRDQGTNKRANRSKPGLPPEERSRDKKRAGKKATYALEAPRKGRPSRKSTRKGANRSKPDTNMVLREARAKGSAKSRYRKANAKAPTRR